jgi:two-component system NtrC family sensor kinase
MPCGGTVKFSAVLRSVSVDVPVGYGFFDSQLRYLSVSPFLARINGLPVEQHLGRTIAEVLPELAVIVEPLLKQVLEKREAGIWEGSAPAPGTNGQVRDWLLCAYPVILAESLLGIGFVVLDHTDSKWAEDALHESETEARQFVELNRATMANMAEGVYTVDMHGQVTYMNPEAERLFGWTSEELLGRRMHDVTHYKHPDGSLFPIEECAGFQVLHEGTVLKDFEDTFIRRDGSFFPVSYSSSRLRNHDGEIVGLVIVFQDISARKRHDREREVLLEQLRTERERLKDFQAQLQEKVGDLENFHDVVVGRELKLMALEKDNKQLKSRVKDLELKLSALT